MIKISPEELRVFTQHIHGVSGISLDASKDYLLESRLGPMLSELHCSSFGELFAHIRGDGTRKLERRLLDLITTGETSFFRDQSPFELLQHKVLPDLIDRRTRAYGPSRTIPLRIWSAACSTGQELYSIAIILREILGPNNRFDIRLLGTDISDKAVATASRGEFNRIEIERGLPKEKLFRYFTLQGESTWKVRDDLRGLATFRAYNLFSDLTALGRFDIVLCRNVAIYFTEKDRQGLFNRIERVLEPDGVLMIGATESLTGLCPQYVSHRYMRSVYYQVDRGNLAAPLK